MSSLVMASPPKANVLRVVNLEGSRALANDGVRVAQRVVNGTPSHDGPLDQNLSNAAEGSQLLGIRRVWDPAASAYTGADDSRMAIPWPDVVYRREHITLFWPVSIEQSELLGPSLDDISEGGSPTMINVSTDGESVELGSRATVGIRLSWFTRISLTASGILDLRCFSDGTHEQAPVMRGDRSS
ncbi:Nonribosomal peptide synthetase [Emericellopsis cladophorae]|uniref:Nonribosomal peptide synthetase n=1 Tax=Emericellopsis cladophorae TaxID=2686198 RepID=A0A9P9Y655_9HYPO|nr:Nonribosomal peptide synthetase [Emericellopsis cladophorae]KAI6783644.1 Nonribosomal peptide synthetase [Emericellopsis cladophorae]